MCLFSRSGHSRALENERWPCMCAAQAQAVAYAPVSCIASVCSHTIRLYTANIRTTWLLPKPSPTAGANDESCVESVLLLLVPVSLPKFLHSHQPTSRSARLFESVNSIWEDGWDSLLFLMFAKPQNSRISGTPILLWEKTRPKEANTVAVASPTMSNNPPIPKATDASSFCPLPGMP